MVGGVTFVNVLPETKCGNNGLHNESGLILLELIGMLVMLSKYFGIVLLMFCIMINVVRNIIYFIILRGILLVVFVVSIMIGSISNIITPFVMIILRYVGGAVFLLIIVLLIIL